jgi:ABC-type nitrate/sulfonate/bicarbonate transport system permease component
VTAALRRARRLLATAALSLWVPVVLVALWWKLSEHSHSVFFPPLRTIWHRFKHLWLFKDAHAEMLPSVEHLVIGLAIATVIGLSLGLLLHSFGALETILAPLIHFFRALPAPALVPGLIALLGIGAKMSTTVIVVGCVWPILLNTMDGLAASDRVYEETAQVYRLSRIRTLLTVQLPSASPQIFAGLRSALQAGIVLMVISDMLGATSGIGYFILNAQQTYSIPDMWTGMIALGVVGTLLNVALVVGERRALRWHFGAIGADTE